MTREVEREGEATALAMDVEVLADAELKSIEIVNATFVTLREVNIRKLHILFLFSKTQ